MSRDELLALLSRVVVRMTDVERVLMSVKGDEGASLEFYLSEMHQRLEFAARCESQTVNRLLHDAQAARDRQAKAEKETT